MGAEFPADVVRVETRGRALVVRLLAPHRVLSTCPVNGGLREDLEAVFNHQSCLPNDAEHELFTLAGGDARRYHQIVCARHGLPPERSAALGTAADMARAARRYDRRAEPGLLVLCTAGASNACRAGDPASCEERDGAFRPLRGAPRRAGTINLIIFIGRELTASALVEAAITATEAKAAALQDLGVLSAVSGLPATGTGTDQIAIGSRLGGRPFTSAGKHTRLGERIGRCVRAAVLEGLERQDGLALPPDGGRTGAR